MLALAVAAVVVRRMVITLCDVVVMSVGGVGDAIGESVERADRDPGEESQDEDRGGSAQGQPVAEDNH